MENKEKKMKANLYIISAEIKEKDKSILLGVFEDRKQASYYFKSYAKSAKACNGYCIQLAKYRYIDTIDKKGE